MIERWIDVKGHSDYEVSSLGNVRKKKNGRYLSQAPNRPGGYLRVRIDGRLHYVHRLVFDSFMDGDCECEEVIHLDGDRHNNTIMNLEGQRRKRNRIFSPRIVRCGQCANRGKDDFCSRFPDDFYCAYGRLKQ